MDLRPLAHRLSKNAIIARYFGRAMSEIEWLEIMASWSQERLQTFELILIEIEGMQLDTAKKASKRHESNQTRLKQRFEAMKANLIQQAS